MPAPRKQKESIWVTLAWGLNLAGLGGIDVEEAAARHISTRPTMSFRGNMQVAIAEARTLVEGGNRVAFFASSNGELERVADILNEYGVPYQLGLEQFDSPPAYLAERAYIVELARSTRIGRDSTSPTLGDLVGDRHRERP